MKGYKYSYKPLSTEMVEEQVLVGCRRCQTLWREPRMMLKDGPRINGPYYDYDYCDSCLPEGLSPEDFASGVSSRKRGPVTAAMEEVLKQHAGTFKKLKKYEDENG